MLGTPSSIAWWCSSGAGVRGAVLDGHTNQFGAAAASSRFVRLRQAPSGTGSSGQATSPISAGSASSSWAGSRRTV